MPFGRSNTMPIPGLESRHMAPPPLPPPTEPFGSMARRAGDVKMERRSYASNFGSINSYDDGRPSLKRRDTGSSFGDEGYASYASTDRYASMMGNSLIPFSFIS